jgi:hypothetical protein
MKKHMKKAYGFIRVTREVWNREQGSQRTQSPGNGNALLFPGTDERPKTQVSVDLLVNRLACRNSAVVPSFWKALVLERREMLLQLVGQVFIGVGIGKK